MMRKKITVIGSFKILKPYIAKQININYVTHAYTHVHLSIIPKYMFLQYPLSHKKNKKIDNNL
jgi:hypothetical protein